jgi:hypothetical protein
MIYISSIEQKCAFHNPPYCRQNLLLKPKKSAHAWRASALLAIFLKPRLRSVPDFPGIPRIVWKREIPDSPWDNYSAILMQLRLEKVCVASWLKMILQWPHWKNANAGNAFDRCPSANWMI